MPPTMRLFDSWVEALAEWGDDIMHGASTHVADREGWDLTARAGVQQWVERLLVAGDPAQPLPEGYVPATNLWMVVGETYVGSLQLRHRLTPALEAHAGHIGYGVRPSWRGRGLATWALGESLTFARRLGLDAVRLSADVTNVASWRTIERQGGRLLDVITPPAGESEPYRRYEISLR